MRSDAVYVRRTPVSRFLPAIIGRLSIYHQPPVRPAVVHLPPICSRPPGPHRHIIACERCPRLRAYCQAIGETRRRAYHRPDLLGAPRARLRRPTRPHPHPRPRPRRPRRQSHRPPLHRRRLWRLHVPHPLQRSASPPNPAPSPPHDGLQPPPCLDHLRRPLRPTRRQAPPAGDPQLLHASLQPKSPYSPASAPSSASAKSPGTAISPISSAHRHHPPPQLHTLFTHACRVPPPQRTPSPRHLSPLPPQHQHRPPQRCHVHPGLCPRPRGRRPVTLHGWVPHLRRSLRWDSSPLLRRPQRDHKVA